MTEYTWTIAYRKRTANRFLRVTNWVGSWAQAVAMAQVFGEANPDLQVWYTSSRDAELKGGVAIEDVANIMVDSGKRIRIVEGGELPAELIARIPAADVARQRWIDRQEIADPALTEEAAHVEALAIAGELYERRPCRPCDATGTARDATLADKVCVSGVTAVVCSACRGEGETLHSIRLAEASAREAHVPSGEPIGDMPNWMLG